MKARYETQAKELESHYQEVFESKIAEVERIAVDSSFKRVNTEMEERIQKDFILKSDHERILEKKTLKMKGGYEKAIQKLQKTFEVELENKTKTVQEVEQDEYSMIINEIQGNSESIYGILTT